MNELFMSHVTTVSLSMNLSNRPVIDIIRQGLHVDVSGSWYMSIFQEIRSFMRAILIETYVTISNIRKRRNKSLLAMISSGIRIYGPRSFV